MAEREQKIKETSIEDFRAAVRSRLEEGPIINVTDAEVDALSASIIGWIADGLADGNQLGFVKKHRDGTAEITIIELKNNVNLPNKSEE